MTAPPSNARNVPYLPVKEGVSAQACQRHTQGWVWNEKWFVPSDLPRHQLHPLIFGSEASTLTPFLQVTRFEEVMDEIEKSLVQALAGYVGDPEAQPICEPVGEECTHDNYVGFWDCPMCDVNGKVLPLDAHPSKEKYAALKAHLDKSGPKVRLSTCDGCGQKVDLNINGGLHIGCSFIYGRRGWRQLEAYDG